MSLLRRALVLVIVCAHWGAAALPCAPLLDAGPEPSAASASPHAHDHAHHAAGPEAADPHAAHRHGSGEAPSVDPSWTAPCPCGCEAEPAGGGPTARVGAALLSDAGEPLAAAPRVDALPVVAARPPIPDLRRDRVPI